MGRAGIGSGPGVVARRRAPVRPVHLCTASAPCLARRSADTAPRVLPRRRRALPARPPPTLPPLHPPLPPSPPRLPPQPPPASQIYVEIERARLTRQLARMHEAKGELDAAGDLLQEVAVVSREGLGVGSGTWVGGGGLGRDWWRGPGLVAGWGVRGGPRAPGRLGNPRRPPPPPPRHGQDGEDRLHPGAGPPVPGSRGLRAVSPRR